MPVYRLSEGKEFLGENDTTFNLCIELFRKNEMVLIFPEGICKHQTQLLPLKKGTARLAQKAISEGINLQIIPVGLSYDSFENFGKNINLIFGKSMQLPDNQVVMGDGLFYKEFNEKLSEQLKPLMISDFHKINSFQNPLFYLGFLLNFPLYFLCQFLVKKTIKDPIFYDSVLFGMLVFLLPIYWILLIIIAFLVF